MKRVERILIKLAIIHCITLLVAQTIILYTDISPYLTKLVQYEGVYQYNEIRSLETFDQMD